jgi:hypothetical protein
MYLRQISVQGVKLLRDVTLSCERDGSPRMWTVLLGENGACKTTLLQSIALAAAGQFDANRLADASSYFDSRVPSRPVKIQGQFDVHSCRVENYRSLIPAFPLESALGAPPGATVLSGGSRWLEGSPNSDESQAADPLSRARGLGGRPEKGWFVAGYGLQRSLPLPQLVSVKQEGRTLDRLESLFGRESLIGPNFVSLFDGSMQAHYVKLLTQALIHSSPPLLPKVSGIELRGRGGVKRPEHLIESHRFDFRSGESEVRIPAAWLSAGYQTIVSWVADLIGQFLWEYETELSLENMRGLVLIDELDLHIHPSWQVTLVKSLKNTFPNVQFVATTHSPMILPALDQDEIWSMNTLDNGDIEITPAHRSPLLMTGSEIYETFFGIDRLYPNEIGQSLQRLGLLQAKVSPSDDDRDEIRHLQATLRQVGVEVNW